MQHPFYFEPVHEEILNVLETFQRLVLPLLLEQGLDDNTLTREVVRRMGTSGLLSLTVPAAFGGRFSPLDSRALCLAREMLGYESSLVDTAFAMQGLGSHPLALAGQKALQQHWLPRVQEGKALAAFAITEPEAGSDVSSLSTTAVLDGDHYVLNGLKRFISNAGIADFYTLFARTGGPGSKGISAFLVEAHRPGLTVEPIELMAAHPIGEVRLENVRIPVTHRLGAEGEGFSLAMQTLDRFRPTVGAAALGMARRALDEALSYTHKRVQFGQPLVEQQLTKARLAEMATELEAARLLVYQAAWTKDKTSSRASREAAMGKLFATEAAQRIIDAALQLHGGNGVVKGSVVERLYREVRALRIYEGTSEIQHIVIAADLIKSWRQQQS